MEAVLKKERALARTLWEGLAGIPRVKLYGTDRMNRRLPVILANVEGKVPSDVGAILYDRGLLPQNLFSPETP